MIANLLALWPQHREWQVIHITVSKFLVKFPSLVLRDEALSTDWTTSSGIPLHFTSRNTNINAVQTLENEGFWIHIEGIPHHLLSINLFSKMISNFADLMDVDMSHEYA